MYVAGTKITSGSNIRFDSIGNFQRRKLGGRAGFGTLFRGLEGMFLSYTYQTSTSGLLQPLTARVLSKAIRSKRQIKLFLFKLSFSLVILCFVVIHKRSHFEISKFFFVSKRVVLAQQTFIFFSLLHFLPGVLPRNNIKQQRPFCTTILNQTVA